MSYSTGSRRRKAVAANNQQGGLSKNTRTSVPDRGEDGYVTPNLEGMEIIAGEFFRSETGRRICSRTDGVTDSSVAYINVSVRALEGDIQIGSLADSFIVPVFRGRLGGLVSPLDSDPGLVFREIIQNKGFTERVGMSQVQRKSREAVQATISSIARDGFSIPVLLSAIPAVRSYLRIEITPERIIRVCDDLEFADNDIISIMAHRYVYDHPLIDRRMLTDPTTLATISGALSKINRKTSGMSTDSSMEGLFSLFSNKK